MLHQLAKQQIARGIGLVNLIIGAATIRVDYRDQALVGLEYLGSAGMAANPKQRPRPAKPEVASN